MILYIRDPENSTRQLLEMINLKKWQDIESTYINQDISKHQGQTSRK